MKKIPIVSTLAFFLCLTKLSAQVIITPMPFQEGYLTIEDVWRVNLICTQNISNATLEVILEDNQHQSIFTASASGINLHTGNNRPSVNAAGARVRYGTGQTASSFRSTGRLPYGEYIVCYRLMSGQTAVLLGEYCQEQTVKPFSPPELLNPYDKEEVYSTLPLLTWKAPFPPSRESVQYSIRVAEIKDRQNPNEALEENIPTLNRGNLSGTILLYPAEALKLVPGRTYVWQVKAYSGKVELGSTEIWTFRVHESEINPVVKQLEYVHFEYLSNDEANIPFAVAQDTIGLIIDHSYMSIKDFKIQITDVSEPESAMSVAPKASNINEKGTSSIVEGVNYFILDLQSIGLTKGHQYLAKASNQKDNYYIRFLYGTKKM